VRAEAAFRPASFRPWILYIGVLRAQVQTVVGWRETSVKARTAREPRRIKRRFLITDHYPNDAPFLDPYITGQLQACKAKDCMIPGVTC
jgi:hypothetical protein